MMHLFFVLLCYATGRGGIVKVHNEILLVVAGEDESRKEEEKGR